jgi:nucleoid-associated protein YgaU
MAMLKRFKSVRMIGIAVAGLLMLLLLAMPGAAEANGGNMGGMGQGGYYGGMTHMVKYGETLSGIAQQYNVTVDALKEANHIMNADWIFVGQRLYIPPAMGQGGGGMGGMCKMPHVVQPGETLGGIAQMYHVNPWLLAQSNGIMNANLIFAGQTLCIPAMW